MTLSDARRNDDLECPACGRINPADARFCAGCAFQFSAASFERSDHRAGADPLVGGIIAERYRIEELIGRGGMGVVYRVEHVRIGKLMAMKLLHGQLAREKDVVKRFKREAEAVSKLDHVNTVQIFDFGQSDGMMYLVMEYLAGRNLGQIIKEEGPLPFTRVARMAAQVCASAAQAHERGIVHRDLKPENIMVLTDGRIDDHVKVLDFGLAKLRETDDVADRSITNAGSILGTPYYMAPEHIRGEAVDARSDVYALSALMYKAVTGLPAFWASSPVGVLTKHLTERVVPPSERLPDGEHEIPAAADRIILRAMEKDPGDRYADMHALREDLTAFLMEVGEAEGLDSGRLARSAISAAIPTESGRQRKVATRRDIDAFERSIRRRSLVGYFLGAATLLLFAGLGAYAWFSRPTPQLRQEVEPNDVLASATPLAPGRPLTAYLGRRLDESRSDADFFLLQNEGGGRREIRVSVSSIPNMDIVIEIYREGISSPVLTADSGAVGMPEAVPNFVINGPTYYLRVRELWESGRPPTENVSDAYEVSWAYVDTQDGFEEEVNDSIVLAETLSVGDLRRGYIGWAGDVDTYCPTGGLASAAFSVSGTENLDLWLRVNDRVTGRAQTINSRPRGEGERTTFESDDEGRYCVQVGASRPKEGLGNNPEQSYTVELLPVESPPNTQSDPVVGSGA